MFKALAENTQFLFDAKSQENFDKISSGFSKVFVQDVQNYLDLDPEAREFMQKAYERETEHIKQNGGRNWMNKDQKDHPHSFKLTKENQEKLNKEIIEYQKDHDRFATNLQSMLV